jgi:hypothetical protein
MSHVKTNAPSIRHKFLNWILNPSKESHVRISSEGRKIMDNPKLSSEMVQKLVTEKNKFIEGEPIQVGANGSTISITRVSDSIKIDR